MMPVAKECNTRQSDATPFVMTTSITGLNVVILAWYGITK